MPASFFDSNVLLHVASGDPDKADKADEILAEGGAISVQVLNEIANVARRKMQLGWRETHEFLSLVRGLLIVHRSRSKRTRTASRWPNATVSRPMTP